MQAWSFSVTESVGRWTSICNPMSHTSWTKLYLQISNHRTGGDSLVACSRVLAPCNRAWSTHHLSQTFPFLPISKTLRRSYHFIGFDSYHFKHHSLCRLKWRNVGSIYNSMLCRSIVINAGEWWNANVVDVENQGLAAGIPPNNSDAFTINGQPGDLYPCSKPSTPYIFET